MRFQKQAFRHRPEQGEYGDCHRTAIACLLDLDRDAVPHFGVHYGDTTAFHAAVANFLSSQGLSQVNTVFQASLDEVLLGMGYVNPRAYYLLGGTSRTGVGHTVVGLGGEIVWDPSLDDAGIVAPMDDGFYWVTYLVPKALVKETA